MFVQTLVKLKRKNREFLENSGKNANCRKFNVKLSQCLDSVISVLKQCLGCEAAIRKICGFYAVLEKCSMPPQPLSTLHSPGGPRASPLCHLIHRPHQPLSVHPIVRHPGRSEGSFRPIRISLHSNTQVPSH